MPKYANAKMSENDNKKTNPKLSEITNTNTLQIYGIFNNVSVIPGQWDGDYEGLWAMITCCKGLKNIIEDLNI